MLAVCRDARHPVTAEADWSGLTEAARAIARMGEMERAQRDRVLAIDAGRDRGARVGFRRDAVWTASMQAEARGCPRGPKWLLPTPQHGAHDSSSLFGTSPVPAFPSSRSMITNSFEVDRNSCLTHETTKNFKSIERRDGFAALNPLLLGFHARALFNRFLRPGFGPSRARSVSAHAD